MDARWNHSGADVRGQVRRALAPCAVHHEVHGDGAPSVAVEAPLLLGLVVRDDVRVARATVDEVDLGHAQCAVAQVRDGVALGRELVGVVLHVRDRGVARPLRAVDVAVRRAVHVVERRRARDAVALGHGVVKGVDEDVRVAKSVGRAFAHAGRGRERVVPEARRGGALHSGCASLVKKKNHSCDERSGGAQTAARRDGRAGDSPHPQPAHGRVTRA